MAVWPASFLSGFTESRSFRLSDYLRFAVLRLVAAWTGMMLCGKEDGDKSPQSTRNQVSLSSRWVNAGVSDAASAKVYLSNTAMKDCLAS